MSVRARFTRSNPVAVGVVVVVTERFTESLAFLPFLTAGCLLQNRRRPSAVNSTLDFPRLCRCVRLNDLDD